MPVLPPLKPQVSMGRPGTCVCCKRQESPAVVGATFTSDGTNGLKVKFWLCDDCAGPLGPQQGFTGIPDDFPPTPTR